MGRTSRRASREHDRVILGDLKWDNHNDGFINICAIRNSLWAVCRDGGVFMDDGNKFGGSVHIDRIRPGYHGIVGESDRSLHSLDHQQRVLLANAVTGALTGNQTCHITF